MNDLARHAVAVAQAHQAAFKTDQALVDRIELLDEAFDTVVVERERLHVGDDFFAQLFVSLLLLARALFARDLLLKLLVLLLAQLLVGAGDLVKGLEYLRFQFGFHCGKRHGVFKLVVVLAAFAFSSWRAGDGDGCCDLHLTANGRRRFGFGPLVGRFEIDDVAQQDLGVVQFVAPDDDGLEGEGAFAQARNHSLAAGFNALGDGDFAFAREQFDGAHFAQVHAHGVVGALGRFGLGFGFDERVLRGDKRPALFFVRGVFGAFLFFFAFVGLDDVDAHVGEHRHDVFDLLRGHFLGRQHGVQLVEGDVAPGLGRFEQLFDRLIGEIEQWTVAIRGFARGRGLIFALLRCLLCACHRYPSKSTKGFYL